MLGIHPVFLIVLLVVVLIIFGPGRLPELGGAIGKGIREFCEATDDVRNGPRGSDRLPLALEDPALLDHWPGPFGQHPHAVQRPLYAVPDDGALFVFYEGTALLLRLTGR